MIKGYFVTTKIIYNVNDGIEYLVILKVQFQGEITKFRNTELNI